MENVRPGASETNIQVCVRVRPPTDAKARVTRVPSPAA